MTIIVIIINIQINGNSLNYLINILNGIELSTYTQPR